MEFKDKTTGIITDSVDVLVCSQCGCEIDTEGLEPFVKVECPDCNSIELVPARLDHFLLQNLLGQGGMGGVYLAVDDSLGRKVALKVMLSSLGDDPKFIETFKREAQSIAKLNHPNIGQIYTFGQAKGQPYIVMELISGNRLDKMIQEKKRVPVPIVMQTGLDIAQGLAAASEAGLLHGDVKPENILYDEKGRAKLVDFGIAQVAHQSQDEGIWGTPYYIAPEKIKRKKTDFTSDMYSLGATLYHAITGQPPFDGETPVEVVKARLEGPPPPLHVRIPDIDPGAEAVIMRMLEMEPSRRHPTYASLISDFKKCNAALGGGRKYPMATIKRKTGKLKGGKKTTSTPPTDSVVPPRPGGRTKIVLRKSSAEKSAPADKPASDAAAARPGPRKTVIRTRKGRMRGPRKDAEPAGKQEEAQAADATAAADAGGKTAARQPKKKKKSYAGLIAFLVVIFVLAATGLILWLADQHQRKVAATLEYQALLDSQRDSKNVFRAIKSASKTIVASSILTETYLADSSNAFFYVTDETFKIPQVYFTPQRNEDLGLEEPGLDPALSQPKGEEGEGENAAPDVKNKEKESDIPEGMPSKESLERARRASGQRTPGAPEPRPQPKPAPKVERNSDLPEGMPTREELDRMRAGGPPPGEPTPKPPPKPATPASAAPPPEVAPEFADRAAHSSAAMEEESTERKIDRMASTVAQNTLTIMMNAADSTTLVARAEILLDTIENARFSSESKPALEEMQRMEVGLKQLKSDTSELYDKTKEIHDEMMKTALEIKAQKDEAKRIAAEKAEAERKKREAERLAKEKAELEKSERAQAKALWDSVVGQIGIYDFKGAHDTLADALPQFKSEVGKTHMQVRIDQTQLMVELKAWLIKRINASPYRYGFGMNSVTARDILAADENGLTITRGNVTWEQVSKVQMLKILKHYLAPAQTQTLSVKVLARLNLGAAVFCILNGGTEQAAVFKDNAIGYISRTRHEAERLVVTEPAD